MYIVELPARMCVCLDVSTDREKKQIARGPIVHVCVCVCVLNEVKKPIRRYHSASDFEIEIYTQ